MSWLTAIEIAVLALPGLPATKRKVNQKAKQAGWTTQIDTNGKPLFRRRKRRGGGLEYHYSVLPPQAVAALATRGLIAVAKPAFEARTVQAVNGSPHGSAQLCWDGFEALPNSKKRIAKARLDTLKRVEALVRAGQTRTAAVSYSAVEAGVSSATIYNWQTLIRGLRADARLPALAPKTVGRVKLADCPDEALEIIKSDWLRLSKPSFEACFDRLQLIANDKGWRLPASRTLLRRLQAQIPEAVQVMCRDGVEKLERMFPPMDRDRSHFHAMEALNADGHRWDVFVVDEPGGKPYRPLLMAIQDLYSNKFVGWRFAKSEGADTVRLAFGDVFRDYGIPDRVWLDNGRGFASKWITGGTPNRFRFKVKPEDPVGVLTALGIQIHWTRPYRGQSKPIERAFRDFCDRISKHPAFEGAYTGNSTSTKPENYGSRAIPFGEFKAIVEAGIHQHNAKVGRRTRVCQAQHSFDQVFEKSYADAPVRRASEAQLRSFLLAAEKRFSDRKTGAVELFGNRYWSEEIAALRGTHVVIRFDPDRLMDPVHVYRLDGSYVGIAGVMHAGRFDDVAAARDHENRRKKWLKAQKELAAFEKTLRPAEIAAMLPEIDELPELPRPKVARLVAGGGAITVAQREQQQQEFEASLEAGLTAFEGASERRLHIVK